MSVASTKVTPPVLHESLSPSQATAVLETLGWRTEPGDIELTRREGKWLAKLPRGHLAWFAATPAGLAALRTERRLLGVLAARCAFSVPRLLAESGDGVVDIRLPVPGTHDPFGVFDRVRDEPDAAAAIGRALGSILAELHTRVGAWEVLSIVPRRPVWPEPRDWILDRLPRVTDDPALIAGADAIIARYEETMANLADDDRVLAHTDLGLHNVSIDRQTLAVRGVFDWETACWTDRHVDFRYLTFGTPSDALLDAAVAVYEATIGRRLMRDRIYLHNAAAAVTYLAYRDGIAPDVSWCGRTLAEDLAWTRVALDRAR